MNSFSKGRRHSHFPSPSRTLQGRAQLYLSSPAGRRNIHQPQPLLSPEGRAASQCTGSSPTLPCPSGTHRRGPGEWMRFETGFKPWPIKQPCYFPSALQQHLPPLALLGRDTRREQCLTSHTSQGASAPASPPPCRCAQNGHIRRVSTKTPPPC